MKSFHHCLRIALLVACLSTALSNAAKLTYTNECNCNNGIVTDDTYHCQCVCFDEYLLPNCLYKQNDNVSMELWIQGPESPDATQQLTGRSVKLAIARGFGADESQFETTFIALQATSVDWEKYAVATGKKFSIFKAFVTMPGWAAQQLLADSLDENLAGYCFSQSDPATDPACSAATRDYRLFHVIDREQGPHTPPLYTDTWMRLYFDTYWYMSLEQCGWFIAAVLITLFFIIIEQKCMYNVDYNVAGRTVKNYNVRQEDIRYRREANEKRKNLRQTDETGATPSRMGSLFAPFSRKASKKNVKLSTSPNDVSRARGDAKRVSQHNQGVRGTSVLRTSEDGGVSSQKWKSVDEKATDPLLQQGVVKQRKKSSPKRKTDAVSTTDAKRQASPRRTAPKESPGHVNPVSPQWKTGAARTGAKNPSPPQWKTADTVSGGAKNPSPPQWKTADTVSGGAKNPSPPQWKTADTVSGGKKNPSPGVVGRSGSPKRSSKGQPSAPAWKAATNNNNNNNTRTASPGNAPQWKSVPPNKNHREM